MQRSMLLLLLFVCSIIVGYGDQQIKWGNVNRNVEILAVHIVGISPYTLLKNYHFSFQNVC